MPELGYSLSCEEHAPNDLVGFAKSAEAAGFGFALVSDHFHPWIDAQGNSPFVWSVIGGVVRVAGKQSHEVVRVSIEDEGVGIPPELQREIFEKFVRGHATAEGIEGSGLGLAISRSLVEAHGGSIDFESTKGRGSTFWFELPTASTG